MASMYVLFHIICLAICLSSSSSSYMGSEQSLRQNIADLLNGKLKFSDETLPYEEDELLDSTPNNSSEYDFIIVGAGSAGATIASRLSEIPNVKVLLVEAGGREYSILDIPGIALPLQFSNEVNWDFKTESADNHCLGYTDRKCSWPRGKVVGGSSVLNYMFATRGNRRDYDEWAKITGDDSWSYASFLKYFKKLENFNVTSATIDEKYHNKGGLVHINGPHHSVYLSDAFVQAGIELGYPEVDYNGAEQTGFSYFHTTISDGERWSVNKAYLRPAKSRGNLIVTQHSHVHKILIDRATKSAYGVRYSKHGQIYEVRAKKEVILSAGAINSPQILMLSGIGPAEHLRKLDIELIKDAPVGENLMDHVAYSGLVFKVNDSATYSELGLLDEKNPAVKDYITSRTGPLAYGLSLSAVSYVNLDDPTDPYPDMEIIFGEGSGVKDPLFAATLGVSEDYQKQMSVDQFNQTTWMIWPMILRPRSRGRILLRSADPLDKPKIHANYFEDPDDVRVMIKGIRMAIKIGETHSMRKYGSERYRVPLPYQKHEVDSDEYWECALRTYGASMYHPAGTCRMGREDSSSSVVNSELKVIGVNKLRVADASIMPIIVSAHTNIPTITIAEKISDSIKRDHGYVG